MATRIKNIDEIVSSTSKTTVLDYTPVAANTGSIDLSLGNNFTVAGATTLSFTGMSGREGQSGNIWITGGVGIDTNSITSSSTIDGDHWVSYFVYSSAKVVISIGENQV
jgi:hypothetical protein